MPLQFMKSGISTTNGCFLSQLTTALILIAGTVTANGQGTVVFSAKMGLYGTNYNEQGMGFRVATLLPENTSDRMYISPAVTSGSGNPYNNTPYLLFRQSYSSNNYNAIP